MPQSGLPRCLQPTELHAVPKCAKILKLIGSGSRYHAIGTFFTKMHQEMGYLNVRISL